MHDQANQQRCLVPRPGSQEAADGGSAALAKPGMMA